MLFLVKADIFSFDYTAVGAVPQVVCVHILHCGFWHLVKLHHGVAEIGRPP